jgi:hypothetical protein
MLTTRRVGDPSEDASMAAARPILSKINELGFVTIDSQMGTSEQRAYVSGFVSKNIVEKFVELVTMESGIMCFSFPHGESVPKGYNTFGLKRMPRVALTLEGSKPVTRYPLGAAMSWGGNMAELAT